MDSQTSSKDDVVEMVANKLIFQRSEHILIYLAGHRNVQQTKTKL